MKKRLLSAALALAMVLTMLPLTAFAADYDYDNPAVKGDGTERVTYVQYDNAKNEYKGAPGWFVTLNVPAVKGDPTKPAKTVYEKVTSGLSVGGYYYKDAAAPSDSNLEFNTDASNNKTGIKKNPTIYSASLDASKNVVKGNLKGAVIVIDGTFEIDAVNATSLSLDVYGGAVTIKGSKLTSVTVNNSQYATYGKNGTVTVDSGVMGNLTSLTLKHVAVSGNISLNAKAATTSAGVAHSLTLEDVTASGTIELDGVGTNTPATRAAQTVNITNSTVGNITVKGINSTVTLTEVKGDSSAPTVTIEGTGGNLNVKGGSTLGTVTLNGDLTSTKAQTTAPSNVTVETGSTVASISSAQNGKEQALGKQTISISGTVSNAVQAKNAALTVNGGQTGALTVDTGAVTVSGNRANVGDVTLTKDAAFTLSGTNCTVGALKVASTGTPATVTFNVPNDPSNTLGGTDGVSSSYTKRTIKGGTWKQAVSAANLDSSLMYQLEKTVSSAKVYTYYTSDQLGEAIITQGSTTGSTLTKIGDAGTSKVTVTFMNGSMKWGELSISPDISIPKLPTQMNNINTPYWSDGKFTNLAGNYSVPSSDTTLNAGGGGSVVTEVTKLTDVKVDKAAANITAALSGNVITLTGAVGTGDTKFTLTLETDAVTYDSVNNKEVPVKIEVGVIFDPSTKELTLANPGSMSLNNGVVIENTFKAIKLSNGTRYTFDGKGLVVRSKNISVKELDNGYNKTNAISENDIEVIVSAPGYTATTTLKQQIIALINGSGAEFTWTDSPAVQRAVNAALATISDTTVQGYINAATAKARSDNRLGANVDTGYQASNTSVWLVPYLEVNVTSYQPNPYNPSLAATLTIKWRVEVHPGSTTNVVKEAANVANDKGVYIAKQGVALSLGDDLGAGVEITFKTGISSQNNAAIYAHQADTYDYKIGNDGKITVTHAVSGNLGKFVLDTKEPLIMVGKQNKTDPTKVDINDTLTYFSTLQAAVDAAEDGQLVEIGSSYSGSTSISMTGKARTIYVQANGKNVVVANASGSMVDVNPSGTFYTIKLNRDNSVVATAASITVNTATNGGATVNVSSARAGSTVTITANPSSGYRPLAPTVRTNTGAAVSVTAGSNNTFTFVVPDGATSITVTPSFVQSTGLPFNDVAANAWYFDGVAYCYNNNLMQGYDGASTTFGVNHAVTRAEVVTVLWRLAGQPIETARSGYNDVRSNEWYYNAISWATNHGYAEGYGDGTFQPNRSVSRQELAVFLHRYAGKTIVGGNLNAYSDGQGVASWATDAMRWATSYSILSGTNSVSLNGRLNAYSTAYREQVAVTLQHFHQYYK